MLQAGVAACERGTRRRGTPRRVSPRRARPPRRRRRAAAPATRRRASGHASPRATSTTEAQGRHAQRRSGDHDQNHPRALDQDGGDRSAVFGDSGRADHVGRLGHRRRGRQGRRPRGRGRQGRPGQRKSQPLDRAHRADAGRRNEDRARHLAGQPTRRRRTRARTPRRWGLPPARARESVRLPVAEKAPRSERSPGPVWARWRGANPPRFPRNR